MHTGSGSSRTFGESVDPPLGLATSRVFTKLLHFTHTIGRLHRAQIVLASRDMAESANADVSQLSPIGYFKHNNGYDR